MRRCATGTSTSPPARCTAPRQSYNIQANGQLMRADGLQAADRHLPERRAGAARAMWPTSSTAWKTTSNFSHDLRRRVRQRGHARRQPRGDAPARQQHHRSHRQHQAAAADVPGADAAHRAPGHPRRPLQEHPRGVPGYSIHHGRHAGAGDHGDLPVPAELLGHHDSGDGAAVLHRRHLLA